MSTVSQVKINEILAQAHEKYSDLIDNEMLTIGVRMICNNFDESNAQVGDVVEVNSRVWCDGEYTNEELDGLSAIGKPFRNPKEWNGYPADKILVLSCDFYTCGNDVGEIIMKEPKVLEIIEVK
jgi:hypothetical protein